MSPSPFCNYKRRIKIYTRSTQNSKTHLIPEKPIIGPNAVEKVHFRYKQWTKFEMKRVWDSGNSNSLCLFIFKIADPPAIQYPFPLLQSFPPEMAGRYNSYDTRSSFSSSVHSDLSSSAEFKKPSSISSKAIVRSKPSDLTKTAKTFKPENPGNLTCMMKKLMEMKKSNSRSKRVELVIPEELKKIDTVKVGGGGGGGGKSTLGTLQRKLFGKEKVKALTEVKGNTRTLSMVLRSERELLSMNKDQEMKISELKFQVEEKNREVEKLKDLCLKQREEIKSLKSALLFPDGMNSQMEELNQARQIIPNLQKQVISLNGQLQCIAQDLAEVKANKYLSESCYWQAQTSSYDSLEFSSGSPDGLALEDLNPCLTPCTKTKPKEFERVDSAEESLSGRSTVTTTTTTTTGGRVKSSSKSVKLSRSSEGKAGQRSQEGKGWYRGGRMF